MKIRFVVLPLMLATALFLAWGCTDKGDPAWGEKQKVLLEELLNKPNVKHGELVIDYKKKQWIVPNLEITLSGAEDVDVICTIASVTGVDVALEPLVEESGMLAERLEIKGLVCRDNATDGTSDKTADFTFKQDSFVVEKLKGGKELQNALLNVGDKPSLHMLKQASMEGLTVQGFTVMEGDTDLVSFDSLSLKNLAEGFVGPVEWKNFAISLDSSDFDSLTIGFMGFQKLGSKTFFDSALKLLEENTSADFYTIYFSAMNMFMTMDYVAEGMEYKDIALVVDRTVEKPVPPITIKKIAGSASFDGEKGFSSSKLENLAIAPETLQYLTDGEFEDYAFKPVDLTVEGDMGIELNGDRYTVEYKKFIFSDPLYGSLSARLSMGVAADAFKVDPNNYTALSYEGAQINNFYLSFEDKALIDTICDIASLSSSGSLEGAGAMRMMGAASVKMQCAQLPAGLQGACNNTAEFLEKKGRIEYTFTPESPLSLDPTLLGKLGEISIESRFTPAK